MQMKSISYIKDGLTVSINTGIWKKRVFTNNISVVLTLES